VALPEEHGGSGLGMLEMALIVEALAATGGGSTVGQLFMINPIFGGVSMSRFGSDRDEAPSCCQDHQRRDQLLHGADRARRRHQHAGDQAPFAAADGDGWRLNGRKIWITGVQSAAKMLVIARTKKLEDSPRAPTACRCS
jgi:acyl-CoA dehydrogenase